jgi:EAL and modified HD-GYP domain-containing signal transduction protein
MDSQIDNPLLARQPIYNRKMQVFGHELQYREKNDYDTGDATGAADKAAAKVIVNAFTSADEYDLFEDLPVFIKVSAQLLLSGHLLSMPPANIVLDIFNDIELDEADIKVIKKYQQYKFRLCIRLNSDNSQNHPFLAFADFIRLDINSLGFGELRRLFSHLKSTQSKARLIVQGIDYPEQLHQCQKLKVELLQGHFISRPAIVASRALSVVQNNSLQLVGELQSPKISAHRIAELLHQSPQVSYRLLRLINSATYELTRIIESLQEAVIYLGLDVICHWVSLMLLADSSNKPKALILTTLIRAKMCESLSTKIQPQDAPRAFLVGLFSTLDAMLDIPMQQALDRLPLSDDVNQALLDQTGPLGGICNCVIAYEQGLFEVAKQDIVIPHYQLFISYGEAVLWAKGVCEHLLD